MLTKLCYAITLIRDKGQVITQSKINGQSVSLCTDNSPIPREFNGKRGTLSLGNTNSVFVRVPAHCARQRHYLYTPRLKATLEGRQNLSSRFFLSTIIFEKTVKNEE